MGKTITDIAQTLCTPRTVQQTITKETKQIKPKKINTIQPVPKVQLIYAFNGTGKTQLSREIKSILEHTSNSDDMVFLYYSAFTEDLFYWQNISDDNPEPKLKIQQNNFIDWIIGERGQDQNIINNFKKHFNKNIIPEFIEETKVFNRIKKTTYPEIRFSILDKNKTINPDTGQVNGIQNFIKISKGEESGFIWIVFYTLLEEIISILNTTQPQKRDSNDFDNLEYVFIDDPVSSLDENHLIELAVSLASLIKKSTSQKLKFVITTHNVIFYNVLFNELNKKKCYLLHSNENNSLSLIETDGDSNTRFSYHLHIKDILTQAIKNNTIEKYHFTLIRNLYEKTASFLGCTKWSSLLPKDQSKELIYNRIIQFTSHDTLSNETVFTPSPQEKKTIEYLLNHLINTYYTI